MLGGVVKWCWCGFVRVWMHCCGFGLLVVVCWCLWVLAMAMCGGFVEYCGCLGVAGQPHYTI